MKCNDIENILADYIEKNVSENTASTVKKHIDSCNHCQQELKEMESFLAVLKNDVPQFPSDKLRANFEEILTAEKRKQTLRVVSSTKRTKNTDWKSFLRVAASILLVVSAFLLGKYQSDNSNTTIKTATHQQQEKEKNVLAMIENQSASKRIQAIDNTQEFTLKDTQIIQAIINRLFFDENTNVRLAAVDALSKFSSLEMVKSAFIKSLETEKEPIIQIELITILAKIQEKRALKPMKKLLKETTTPVFVKQELKLNISNLS